MMQWSKWAIIGIAATAGLAFTEKAEAATMQRTCLVDSVGVLDDRVHIKCAPVPASAYTGQLLYYAMNLSEGSAKIESIVMLAIESKRRNKAMTIQFDMDDYRSVAGCLGFNCRVLKGAIME